MSQPVTKPEDLPTTPQQLLALLDTLGITYTFYEHAPVFTVAEGANIKTDIAGVGCRNLFLRDKKKNMFLVVLANETEVNLKQLEDQLNCGRLSFGSAERLWQHLGVTPGSVCPFAVINDKNHAVKVILDAGMMQADLVNYHPLLNTMSVALTPTSLRKFFKHTGHETVDLGFSE